LLQPKRIKEILKLRASFEQPQPEYGSVFRQRYSVQVDVVKVEMRKPSMPISIVMTYLALNESLSKLKGKNVVKEAVPLHSIDPELLKIDVAPLASKMHKNRTVHTDYIRHTLEEAATLREIVESKRLINPLNTSLDYALPHREPIPIASNTDKPVITLVYSRKSKATNKRVSVVRIILWYLDPGCSKHMTEDRSQLINYVQKFLGTVKFENDHGAKIMGYGDYHIRNVTISRVYYVEGLGHNLFYVGQFCDSDLEVAFCQHTCFILNLHRVDLLTGSRGNNLYTLSLKDMMASSPICLLSKASKTMSWLWHRRLSHLNFGAINHLARQGLVRGLQKLKFKNDHLCSACVMGKSMKNSHKPKSEDTNQEKLYLLHMDLYGPMRVESVNGKKYILVIVDDYSRFTLVKFLRSKDEAPDFIIKFLKMIQVWLKVPRLWQLLVLPKIDPSFAFDIERHHMSFCITNYLTYHSFMCLVLYVIRQMIVRTWGSYNQKMISRSSLAMHRLRKLSEFTTGVGNKMLKVIEFGDSYKAPKDVSDTGSVSEGSAKKKRRTVVVTTEDMQKRRNDVKARTTLLHLVEMKPPKRLRRISFKRQYGNFKAEGTETLEKTFNRLQAIISHLEFMDVEIKQDDLNQKFLTSLASEWLIFWKKTGKKITIQGIDVAGFDKSKVECFNCHKTGSYMENEEENHALVADQEALIEFALMAKSSAENKVFDNSFCSKACKKNTDSLNTKIIELSEKLSDNKTMLYHYKLGLSRVEAILVEFKNQEIKFCEKIKGFEFNVESKNNRIERLTNELEELKKEKESLDSKLTGGGKITGKGIIKTGKLEFKNVYFVKDLKYNLFSVSLICDNKNSVLFTDSECIVLGRDFKLKDDTNVLLRTPRQHNMYSIDLNNIVPHKDLTCLVGKAPVDECMLWYMRLGHLNFKTMNKLVRHNLVRGLPYKCFENDHTCVACLKGKQHKASCKTKLVNLVSKPLHTLHMNLFGPTSVSSLNHKWYCLVVTDDFSRCDNGGEFRNKEMNDFCSRKRITREFSNARTPQQNGAAERRSRTLIEAARTIKAFRVFNKRTKRVEENLHVDFLENKLIEKGASLNWLFDIDTLTNSMNYVPVVVAGTSFTNFLGTKDAASQDVKKDVSSLRYIALPNWFHEAHLESSTSNAQDACNADAPESSENFNPTATSKNPPTDQIETLVVETAIPTVSSPIPTACLDDSLEPSNTPVQTRTKSKEMEEQSFIATIHQKTTPDLLQFCLFLCFLSQEEPKKIFDALKDTSWDPEFLGRVYTVEKAMYGLYQAPRAWHQVTPKEYHLHTVKRIFRYPKGHLKLGRWYPKESPFDLVAYSDSNYGGATQDRKSTTGGC
nr:ribonuclease H-like domain-containing protein [Tanacetum cinerariifolium]